MKRLRLLIFAAVVGVVVVATPATASAHAVLEHTTPGDGDVVEFAPDEVTLQFNELISVRDGAISVVASGGASVEVQRVRVVDTTVHVVLPKGLGDGSYVVSWRVISADSHTIAGAFVFSIGAPTAGPVASPTSVDPGTWTLSVARTMTSFLEYLGLLIAVGLVVFVVFIYDDGPGRGRLGRVAVAAGVTGVVGILAGLPVRVADLVGSGWSGIYEMSAWGDVLLGPSGAAGALAIAATGVLLLAGQPVRRSPMLDATVGAAAVGVMASFLIVGHTRTFGPWWIVVTSDLVHTLAAAIWLGGLTGLWLTIQTRVSDPDIDESTLVSTARVVGRFSTIAAGTLIGVGVFGSLLGWRIIGSFSALTSTGYGRTLLVKVAVVAIVAAIGGYNRTRLVPGASRSDNPSKDMARLGRTVRAEVVLLVIVVMVTALLVDHSPADAAKSVPASQPRRAAQQMEVQLGESTATVVVQPGRIGTNTIKIQLQTEGGGPLEAVTPPVIELTQTERGIGPISRTTRPTDPGRYAASINIPVSGRWDLRISARLSTYDSPIAVTKVDIDG